MKNIFLFIVFSFLTLTSVSAFSWGGRGHHTLCDAAVYLVQDPDLQKFLKSRPHTMGHLCNIPDIYWKSLSGEYTKQGNFTHFLDTEITGLKLKDISTDFSKLSTEFTGKKKANKDSNIVSFPHEFGSLWWRAQQFYQRSLEGGKQAGAATNPQNQKEEQDENQSYNKGVYQFLTNLGLMGHFVGDAAQPLHNTDDYDGYEKGHGGLHSYYEDFALTSMDHSLSSKVLAAAQQIQKKSKSLPFLSAHQPIEKVKALSIVTFDDLPKLLEADALIKPSEVKKEKGMEIKKVAERTPFTKTKPKFEKLLVTHLARGAVTLAALWDQAYLEAGKPSLAAYRSFKYPFTPEFVMPDYYQIPSGDSKSNSGK